MRLVCAACSLWISVIFWWIWRMELVCLCVALEDRIGAGVLVDVTDASFFLSGRWGPYWGPSYKRTLLFGDLHSGSLIVVNPNSGLDQGFMFRV